MAKFLLFFSLLGLSMKFSSQSNTTSGCHQHTCSHGGRCVTASNSHGYICHCAPGFTGQHCQDSPHCLANPCHHHGVCIPTHSSPYFKCSCHTGFYGRYCEHVDHCASNPCNGGTCERTQTTPHYQCSCRQGYHGTDCQYRDGCLTNPCTNNGICHKTSHSPYYACHCSSGYYGTRCQYRDGCLTNHCTNNGICIRTSHSPYYACHCSSGYYGDHCQYISSTKITTVTQVPKVDICASHPCSHGGVCLQISTLPYFRCVCHYGFQGDLCEENNICASSRCLNYGMCHTSSVYPYYHCICRSGFYGLHCEYDHCTSHFCKHGGTCVPLSHSPYFTCKCSDRYHGHHCEMINTMANTTTGQVSTTTALPKNLCTSTACFNGGTCNPLSDGQSYKCSCPHGLTGDRCEFSVHSQTMSTQSSLSVSTTAAHTVSLTTQMMSTQSTVASSTTPAITKVSSTTQQMSTQSTVASSTSPAIPKGPTCLSCNDVLSPHMCEYISHCRSHESCFIDMFVSHTGSIRYNLGCRDMNQCAAKQATNTNGADPMSVLVCSECCQGTVCNSGGCSQSGYPDLKSGQRGPLCYQCDQQATPDDCSKIQICGRDEVCHTESLITGLAFLIETLGAVEGAHRVDGNWGSWTNYSECSHTCGYGSQSRWRYCNNPRPSHHGLYCQGEHHETRPCHIKACPINGVWGQWTWYQACSVTCGTGSQTRYRYCNSPHPSNGGLICVGDSYTTRTCSYNSCPGQVGVVNGGWGEWSSLTQCTHSCGGGTQSSYRWCDKPRPSGGGATCSGSDIITHQCNTQACPCLGSSCPVNGAWGKWTDYTKCSTSCGDGTQTRYRYCNSPHPAHGGKACVGDQYETQNCYLMACPGATVVNGGWSLWSVYSACSKSCGSGYQTRHRTCDNPRPSSTGSDCVGSTTDTQTCHTEACPCSGHNCPVNGGWGNWLPFSSCSHTCGTGTKTRWRYCNHPRPSNGGQPCHGSQTDTQSCHVTSCVGPSPVDGGWTYWASWSTCTQTCGAATHSRHRTCSNPAPAHGGSYCTGSSTQTQSCHLTACPAHSCGTTLVSTTDTKIVGGKLAQHGQFPWQISLRYFGEHLCGGTLISDQWVLTAAHCFEDLGTVAREWSIGIGLHDQQHVYGSNMVHVSHVYVHEHYNSNSEKNDIALLKLNKKIDITGKYVRPACLPKAQDIFDSDTCTASGWGATYYDDDGNAPGTRYLMYVNLDTITNNRCKSLMGWNSVYNTNICAGAIRGGGKDTCQGDSGGPLVCQNNGAWEIAGVTSWGDGCGKSMSPGVYTRVSSYLGWIQQKMNSG